MDHSAAQRTLKTGGRNLRISLVVYDLNEPLGEAKTREKKYLTPDIISQLARANDADARREHGHRDLLVLCHRLLKSTTSQCHRPTWTRAGKVELARGVDECLQLELAVEVSGPPRVSAVCAEDRALNRDAARGARSTATRHPARAGVGKKSDPTLSGKLAVLPTTAFRTLERDRLTRRHQVADSCRTKGDRIDACAGGS